MLGLMRQQSYANDGYNHLPCDASYVVNAQEDELANLQRSLQALSGPTHPSRPAPTMLRRPAIPNSSGTGDTGVFCEDNQEDRQQQYQGLGQRIGGRSSLSGPVPHSKAAPASVQQPRPVSSLISSSLQHRQLQISQIRKLKRPSPSEDGGGLHHSGVGMPGQANNTSAQQSVPAVLYPKQAQVERQFTGNLAWQQRVHPPHSKLPSILPHPHRAVQQTPNQPAAHSHMQHQALKAAGQADKQTSKSTVQQSEAVAAGPLSPQHDQATKQHIKGNHHAVTPSLDPVLYTVQEPDSPPQQGARSRQGTSGQPQMQMPPSCIFMEATITRCVVYIDLHGRFHCTDHPLMCC